METQEQKKIHVNPDFITGGGQRVKPKVHFNPAFLQKSTAVHTSYHPVSSVFEQNPVRLEDNFGKYEVKRPVTSSNSLQNKYFTPQHPPVKLSEPHSKLSYGNKCQTLKNKHYYGKKNNNIWQYTYSKQNPYTQKSVQLPHPTSPVKTSGGVAVKPPSAYSWTSKASCNGTQATHSASTATSSGRTTLVSVLSAQNHVQAYHKKNSLGVKSENLSIVAQQSKFKFVKSEAKVSPVADFKVSQCIKKEKGASLNTKNIKTCDSVNVHEVSNRKNLSTNLNKIQTHRASTSMPTRDKSPPITSKPSSKPTSQGSSILVNPKFLQNYPNETQTLALTLKEPSLSLEQKSPPEKFVPEPCRKDKFKIVSRTKLVRQNITPKRKADSVPPEKFVSEASRNDRFKIVSKTKLIRKNITPKRKGDDKNVNSALVKERSCLSISQSSPRGLKLAKSLKAQSPAFTSSFSPRTHARKHFPFISRTKIVRSQSGDCAEGGGLSGKPKYSYKTKTKLIRSHSDNISDKGIVRTPAGKTDIEGKRRFHVLSKTKLVRRRSNSGSYKTKALRSAGKVSATYPGKRAIIKRHKLVRNASLSPHHRLRSTSRDSRFKYANTPFRVTKSYHKLSVNQKLAKGIVSKYKINRLKSEPFVVTPMNSRFQRYPVGSKKRYKSSVPHSQRQTGKRSDRFINIGGIMYKSTKTTLRKQCVKTNPQMSRSRKESCIVILRGEKFQLGAGGRTLKRVDEGSASRHMATMGLPRVHIGRRIYSRTKTGVYKLTTIHQTRAVLSSARHRSLATLQQRRKKGQMQKRNQFCMFFNRFGRCAKKERGECPFIHDPKRVAVCTRFLRGRCPVKTCPFSHTVDPDKMPVCSHFLRSICTRDPCPYRHVKVNPAAPICLDFVKGLCKAGAECKKQHVLVCEEYQSTGKCPRGTACPLSHHKRKKFTSVSTRPAEASPGKKESHMLNRKRKRSESDVLGRPKSKKRTEKTLVNTAGKVPYQRYFSMTTGSTEMEEEDVENCAANGEKGNSESSSVSNVSATPANSASLIASTETPEKHLSSRVTDRKYVNLDFSSATTSTPITDFKETRLRLLEKVELLKKAHSAYTNCDNQANTNTAVKGGGQKLGPCEAGVENAENVSSMEESCAIIDSDSVSINLVQRAPLPRRLPSFISLTMDEAVEDM